VFLTFDGVTADRPDALDRKRHARTDWAIRLDRLTAIMLVVITTVSALVHLYSFGYMAHDDNWREGELQGRASSPICRSSPSPC
jgi:NADH-quinone oxidoreductase subunit L